MDPAFAALDILGPGKATQIRKLDMISVAQAIQKGLPEDFATRVLEQVPREYRASWKQLIEGKNPQHKLSQEEGERAVRLAYILELALEVWGSQAEAWAFLERPHAELGQQTPLETAKSEFGGRLVESLLRKIQFGLPA